MENVQTVFVVVVTIISLISLGWHIFNHLYSYLHIDLSVARDNQGFVTAKTTVENRSHTPKIITNALLLVGPETESPIETMNALGFEVEFTNDILRYELEETTVGPNGRCLIPIGFFYSENIRIADETVSYRVPISVAEIQENDPYSVRFFVSAPKRLHRSTHDCFVLGHHGAAGGPNG